MESESLMVEFLSGSRFSKTRDAIFLYCFKHCLTYYIERLNKVSLLKTSEKPWHLYDHSMPPPKIRDFTAFNTMISQEIAI